MSVGLEFIASLEEVCPADWVPLPGNRRWCDLGRRDYTCYWTFQYDQGRVLDWSVTRRLALLRDHGICRADGCGRPATEVDHIVEIQDGGAEFDLENVRSLCHDCHVVKTSARRRWGPKRAERALLERNHPELLPRMEAFL